MNILVAGDWHSELHEEAVYQALRKLGHHVGRFSWHDYFRPQGGDARAWGPGTLYRRVQNKLIAGPAVTALNRDFLRAVKDHKADLVFVYRGTHLTAATLARLKQDRPSTVLVGYNNDDPFSDGHPSRLWRHFIPAISIYDLVLAYRHRNLDDYSRHGARQVRLLRSWYTPERNHPARLNAEERDRFGCDVVFVGHYENDGRMRLLERVVRAGLDLKLFGPGYDWDPVIRRSAVLRHLAPVRLVWGRDYNRALCGAKVGLCFLSKLNRDTYTRRCFEIPASGTLLLSEYTDDLATLFREGAEADFFRSDDELIAKLHRYVQDDGLRERVAAAGHRRVVADRHDIVSRMQDVLDWVTEREPMAVATS